VVNEAISDKPLKPWEYLRDTPALRAIGDDYVRKAFEFAHAADPDVRLYYNDYNVENPVKLRKVLRLLRSLKGAGVRLDAIGIQGHWLLHYPDASAVDAGITALGKEGIKVLVTELDVNFHATRPRGNPPPQPRAFSALAFTNTATIRALAGLGRLQIGPTCRLEATRGLMFPGMLC
jgi:endo-1,4-beta-xylanase